MAEIVQPSGGEGVTTINGLDGDITLTAGSNITLTPVGNTITIASTGGGSSTPHSSGITVYNSLTDTWENSILGTSSEFVKGDGSLDSSTYIQGVNTAKITVSATAPISPMVGDLWINTSA